MKMKMDTLHNDPTCLIIINLDSKQCILIIYIAIKLEYLHKYMCHHVAIK